VANFIDKLEAKDAFSYDGYCACPPWKCQGMGECRAELLKAHGWIAPEDAAALERGVWVPREPTKEMVTAGMRAADSCVQTGATIHASIAHEVWRSMLRAAPGGGDSQDSRSPAMTRENEQSDYWARRFDECIGRPHSENEP
jgi:hypothetical protein